MLQIPKLFYTLLALWTLSGAPVLAQNTATRPLFGLPLACTPGVDCWVLNYPDAGPDKDGAATDPACLSRTYEDHKGTDFAILDEATMKKGVDVRAALEGTIARVRDGEADRWPTPEDLEKTKAAKRECGNAVLIEHADGWQTMYCHMKKGSIVVKPGQTVKKGDKIGQLGLSGMTEFPHLHIGIIHKDKVMEPFTGTDINTPCGMKGTSLWEPSLKLTYEPLVFFHLGFDTKPPTLEGLGREKKDRSALRKDSAALVFHTVLLGARLGDTVTLEILDPDGNIFAQSKNIQEKSRAQQMFFVGRKISQTTPLIPGSYIGKITVERASLNDAPQIFKSEKSILIQ